MNPFQLIFLLLWFGYAMGGFLLGLRQTYYKKNPYGLSFWLNPLGAFVWGDAVIFGIFNMLIVFVAIILKDFILFLLLTSVFWVVRSIGEQMYWFHEQFATNHRNLEHTLRLSKFFPRNSVWIAMQIYWQCVSVVAIVSSVYLFFRWLK